jgi:hypothetical protein
MGELSSFRADFSMVKANLQTAKSRLKGGSLF